MPTNPYELVFIVDAAVDESEVQRLTDETKRIIKEAGGEMTKESNWGTRRLSFEIKKRMDGVYVTMEFNALETVPDRLRVFYKTQINLLRHLILKVPKAKLIQEKIDAERKEKELRESEKRRQEELAAQKAAAEAAAQRAAEEAAAQRAAEEAAAREASDAPAVESSPGESSDKVVEVEGETSSESNEQTPQPVISETGD